jgi:hypothetical protein
VTELDRTGGTRFNLPATGSQTGSEDPVLAAVKAAAAPDYEVLGEIARSARDGKVLFLARARVGGTLVALRLSPGTGPEDFLLELVRQLDSTLPSPEGTCWRCGKPFTKWARFCGHCGAALWGDADPHASPRVRAELRAAVEEAARGRYEILGEMEHGDGPGVVYFAREHASGHIEALRVRPEGAEEYSIGKTNVMRRLTVSVESPRAARPPARPAPTPAPAVQAPRPAAAPPVRPPVVARPPFRPPAPPQPAPVVPRRRSLHIRIPDIPEFSPLVWVLIGAFAFAVLVIILL